jgi:hypothetical protein
MSENVVYKAEVVIFYKALSFRKLRPNMNVMYPYATLHSASATMFEGSHD